MKKYLIYGMVLIVALVLVIAFAVNAGAAPSALETGMILFYSPQGDIPIIEELHTISPCEGFPQPYPFTVWSTFIVPEDATAVYATIAGGPCWAATFGGAAPAGWTSGSYPTQACSWVMWEWDEPWERPDYVSVWAEYQGPWEQHHIHQERWAAKIDGQWEYYCLVGEPVGSNCPFAVKLAARPANPPPAYCESGHPGDPR